MRKYNRILVVWMCAFGACESLEGERKVVEAARISVLIPANWEMTGAPGALLELQPRGVKTVKVRVVSEHKRTALETLVAQEIADANALEKKGIKVPQITRMDRAYGVRLVFEMTAPPNLQLKQIEDLRVLDDVGVALLALGPTEDVDRVSGEIERIMTSVRGLTSISVERPQPPDAVTSASQKL